MVHPETQAILDSIEEELRLGISTYDHVRSFLTPQEPFTCETLDVAELPGIFRKYSIPVEVIDVTYGPRITTVKLKLHAVSPKINVLMKMERDLAFFLKVESVRITLENEEGLVHLELPNHSNVPVRLSWLLSQRNPTPGDLEFPAGVEPNGTPVWYSLKDIPHLLVAGTTGSGKSVFLNTLILSLIAQYSCEDMNLLLIDPKRGVEFGPYERLEHLVTPACYTTEDAYNCLSNLVGRMNSTYGCFKKAGVREISGYNEWADSHNEPTIPFTVVVIDEAAFLFEDYPDIQDLVINLAQLGRAAGIHIIMATQRPSADIITGRLKANFPGRVSFLTASAVDSKVILDRTGAEKLLGHGDALFHIAGQSDKRLQSCYVDSGDIQRVLEGQWGIIQNC